MKKIIGLALLLMFVAGVLFFAPAGNARASNTMPQNDNTMRGSQDHHRRHHRRHHRWERRHHRRHHRMGRHSDQNSNM